MAASSSSGGSSFGTVRASKVLPEPGGPMSSSPWPPASAISSPRLASAWPRTSARSGTTVDGRIAAVGSGASRTSGTCSILVLVSAMADMTFSLSSSGLNTPVDWSAIRKVKNSSPDFVSLFYLNVEKII